LFKDFTGLSPNSTHTVEVRAGTGGVFSAYASISASTVTIAPPVPTGLTSSAITDTSFTVTWSASSGADEYQVRIDGGTAASQTGLSKSYSGLTAGTAYTVEVRAGASGIYSAYSSSLGVTTTGGSVRHSVFGPTTAPYAAVGFTDGGGNLTVCSNFYRTTAVTGTINVVGARIWCPANMVGKNVVMKLWMKDWTGSILTVPVWASPLREITIPSLVAGWNSIDWLTPVLLPAIAASSGGNDVAMIGYRFSDGQGYVHYSVGSGAEVNSGTLPGLVFAESGIPRSFNNIGDAAGIWYGVDIIVDKI
jgi:hypothetical protein